MRSARRHSSVRSSLNDRLSWLVLFVLFVSPLLFGSNRPVFWAAWGVILSLTGIWWFWRMSGTSERLRVAVRHERFLSLCFLTMGAYMVLQALPLGLASAPVSTPTSPDLQLSMPSISLTPGDTLLSLVRWVSYGLLFFFTLQLAANRSRAFRFIRAVYWIIVIQAVIALAFRFQFGDTILGIAKTSYLGSITGGFVNRNSFATYLAFGVVLGLALVLERTLFPAKSRDPKAPRLDAYTGKGGVVQLLVGWLIILATLFGTNSRMGTASALIAVFVMACLATAKLPRGAIGKPGWLIAGGMLVVLVALFLLHGQTLFERLGTAGRDQDVRLDIYRQVISMIKVRPLLGFGGNSFEFVYPLYHDFPVSIEAIFDKTHNTYLSNWVEYGLVFGSIPLLICGFLLLKLVRAYLDSAVPDMIIMAGLGTVIVAAVHSLTDFSLEIEGVTFLFTALVAAAYSRSVMRTNSESDD